MELDNYNELGLMVTLITFMSRNRGHNTRNTDTTRAESEKYFVLK